MESLKAQEEKLFRELRQRGQENLVSDGVVNERSYSESKMKLLFVMKEVNDLGGGGWDLKEYLADGGRPQTWDNVSRWVRGAQGLPEILPWKDLEVVTGEQRKKALQEICVMNLKKTPGGDTADNNDLWRYATKNKNILKRQFELYQPDFVICCGSVISDILHEEILKDHKPEWKFTTRGIWFNRYSTKTKIVSYSHPAARVADSLLHYGFVDAIGELFGH